VILGLQKVIVSIDFLNSDPCTCVNRHEQESSYSFGEMMHS